MIITKEGNLKNTLDIPIKLHLSVYLQSIR